MSTSVFAGVFAVALSTFSALAAESIPDARVFELRTYHAAPGKLDALLARFRNHTTKLFEKHGMTNIGYWVPAENTGNLLVYLLAFPDAAAREASWKAFVADPEWKKVVAESEANGGLVTRADSVVLGQTAFSPGFDHAVDGPARWFEMRTYTTTHGNLTALHQRFQNHTLALFKKHGMTNLGYFKPAAGQPGADDTLIYFLAHKDAETAAKSWTAFRADPDWLAAKAASESAAGGSLTTPDGVKSVFLKATDFSPLR